ncbi:DUF3824 domain-containing protein [Fodinicola acaciae]|uniref:DUF3824 domain-containing protein n=1 Tax=Fodinicola acaciae TaxID=2681555 RepID=UPI0013D00148|nr:DUF3824 domain-containing protein [Fodinicola acaciae]
MTTDPGIPPAATPVTPAAGGTDVASGAPPVSPPTPGWDPPQGYQAAPGWGPSPADYGQPEYGQPAYGQSSYEPAPYESAPAEPAMAEPAMAEPAMAEPAMAEPAMAEPAMAEPAPAEAAPPYQPVGYEQSPYRSLDDDESQPAYTPDEPELDVTPEPGRQERPSGLPPRLGSLLLALTGGVLAAAIGVGGGLLNVYAYAGLVVIAQLLVAGVWVFGRQSANRFGVVGVSLAATLVADTFMLLQGGPLGSLGYHVMPDSGAGPDLSAVVGVVAIAWIATILVQLGRGRKRAQVTEAFGSTMVLTVTMVALGASIPLVRNDGAGVLAAFVAISGSAALVSHLSDVALPKPALAPGVQRGVIGLALGAVASGVAGALAAKLIDIAPVYAGLLGVGVGLVTMLLDLGQSYAVAGRLAAGENLADSTVRPMLGPCLAIAMTVLGAWTYGAVVL